MCPSQDIDASVISTQRNFSVRQTMNNRKRAASQRRLPDWTSGQTFCINGRPENRLKYNEIIQRNCWKLETVKFVRKNVVLRSRKDVIIQISIF